MANLPPCVRADNKTQPRRATWPVAPKVANPDPPEPAVRQI